MKLSQLVLALGLAAALGMAACGDDSSGGGGGTPAEDCADCAADRVSACETAVQICMDVGVAVDQCIQEAIQEICVVQ